MRILSADKLADGHLFIQNRKTMTAGFKLLREGATLALRLELIERKRSERKNSDD